MSRRFFGAILDRARLPPHAVRTRLPSARKRRCGCCGETSVRFLVIDEVHNILSGSRLQQRRLLNLLRWLGNELQIPLVAVGTAEALHAVQSDDQLANRFEPIGLPPWRDGEEYRQLLSTLEALLPLRRPSQLAGAGARREDSFGRGGYSGRGGLDRDPRRRARGDLGHRGDHRKDSSMRSDSSPLRSVAVLRFEVIDADPGRPGFRPSRPQLPLYVEPAAGRSAAVLAFATGEPVAGVAPYPRELQLRYR